jgi:exonuclease SbcC
VRIKRLTIAGFGPYKSEQHIDFESFRDDGLFLITGKTGAGKSSILDAICYALYGSIPRFEGAQPKLRSDHCAPEDVTFVELEFAVNDVDYLLRRVPDYERQKKSGTGTTLNKGTAELSRRVEGEWQTMAVGPRVVALELDQVVSLTKEQFLQVILLAQNRFQEFLLAKNDERQAVLRTLFGTRRFEQIEATLLERHKAVKAELEAGRQGMAQQAVLAASLLQSESVPAEPDLDWFEAGLAELHSLGTAAEAAAHAADESFRQADATHRVLVETQKLQQRREAAAARLATLECERIAIDADRTALSLARRAATVWSQVVARREAAATLEAAEHREAAARSSYDAFSPNGGSVSVSVSVGGNESVVDGTTLSARIEAVTRRLGTLDTVLADELSLPSLDADISELKERLEGCEASVAEATERIEMLPQRIDATGTALSAAQLRAAGEAEMADRLARVRAALDAATLVVVLEQEHGEALIAETKASGDNAAAAARVHELMQQRLAGHAAELASGLIDGEPCTVCGSASHPAPAVWDGTPVGKQHIEDARTVATRCAAALEAAHAATQDVGTRLTEARAKADNKAVAELENDRASAEEALGAARAAGEEAARLEGERAGLREELAAAEAHLSELRTAAHDVSKRLVALQSSRAAIDKRVAAHLGEYESISELVANLHAHLAAANQLSEAMAQTRMQRKTLKSALAALSAQLLEQGFGEGRERGLEQGEQAVEAARRSASEIAALETRIRQHDQSVATAEETLADPELALIPIEPVDVSEAAITLEDARAARDEALSDQSSAGERLAQLARIVASVRAQRAASVRREQEYAQLRELASVVAGNEPNTKRMRLETYVLAAQLEEIVAAANVRLRTMTSGRYTLEHDDSLQYRNVRSGLGLLILDEHTGRARATHSLSGGETFLASLALALGLAEVVTNQAGGITLDTLFIDEGFGSLDADTLEIAMGTLDGLRAGGRTIGLISHVDAMKEQIPAKLRITVTDHGYSEIEESYELVGA